MFDLVMGPGSWHVMILPKLELNAKAVVWIVLGFAPDFEVANFVSRLLQVATIIFVFRMCCL